MRDDLARRSHAVLMRAVELDEHERARYVDEACASDPLLREHVAALLAAMEKSGGFLETPVLQSAGTVAPAPSLALPTHIRNYQIVRAIGVGGMATVYEAVQEQPRRRVALKVLRHGLGGTSAVQRFQFETEVLARLQHPGIAQIYEAGTHDDGHGWSLPYFAMEYVADAATITAYADAHKLTLEQRLSLFAEVCDAVQYGHQNGVIHRDLKPGNILIGGDGRPKVIDFGVARPSDAAQATITHDSGLGQLIGTLHYMSPEQCASTTAVDIRADIYALGVVLYQLLCGRLPHDLSHVPVPEALRIIREVDPRRPGAIDAHLNGDIDAIVMKAIEKDPERRYSTAGALAADIRRHLRCEPVEARPPTMAYRSLRFIRRHRWTLGAACFVLISIIGGAALSARFAYRAWLESKQRIAAEELAVAERDSARWQTYVASIAAAFGAVQVNEYTHARSHLLAAPEEHRDWEWRLLAGIAEGSEQTVTAHDDMIFGFALSPDGQRLATAGRDGGLRVWNAADGSLVTDCDGLPGVSIFSVAFSADANRLVTGADDGTVRLWDASTGQTLCTMGRHSERVESVSFSPRGLVASASADGQAMLWNADSAELVRRLEPQPGGIVGVLFSRDGGRLVAWGHDGLISLRDADDGAVLQYFSVSARIEAVALSDDGALLAAGGNDGRVLAWDAQRARLLQDFTSPVQPGAVRSIALSPDGSLIAAGQLDRDVSIYSIPRASRVAIIRGHGEAVSGLAFSPDADRLYTASWDRTFRVWRTSRALRPGRVTALTGHSDHVLGIAFAPDGSMLASASRDHTIMLWAPQNGTALSTLRGHAAAVSSVAFSPGGEQVASGSYDRTVRLWNVATSESEAVLTGHSGPVWTIAYSPDGKQLASAGDDAVIRIWDLATRTAARTLRGHAGRVTSVAWSEDGLTLASASRDESVRLWDPASGAVRHVLNGHESDVFAVLFSPDGRRLFTGSRDQSVRVWDVTNGACLRALTGHGQFVTSLAMHPYGTRLAAGSWFGEVVLWDPRTLEQVTSFKANYRPIRAVAFSPDGRWLATGSYDNTVRLFDAAPGRPAFQDAP